MTEAPRREPLEPAFRPATGADVPLLLAFMGDFYAFEKLPFDEQKAGAALEGLIQEPSRGGIWLMAGL